MVETPSLTRLAYRAQEAAVRLPLVAAHLGLRPFSRRVETPGPAELAALRRRHRALLERDIRNVEAGLYPARLLFQMPVREYLRGVPSLVREIVSMMARARRGRVRDLPQEIDLGRYPDYFRRNFHWQTDGYLSERSAAVYDAGVEFLFLGTADVMRRQIVPPITRFLERDRALHGPGPRRILDVAAGTGRTLLQLATAHPAEKYYALDLSPYYLKHAARILEGVGDVSYLVENAERMPFRDAELDVVTSTYLFHELPARARRNVLSEMKRVLRPGGLLVLEDAAQLADAPELRVYLENFAVAMNEPFLPQYLDAPLEELVTETGFELASSEGQFLSKVIVAENPA